MKNRIVELNNRILNCRYHAFALFREAKALQENSQNNVAYTLEERVRMMTFLVEKQREAMSKLTEANAMERESSPFSVV